MNLILAFLAIVGLGISIAFGLQVKSCRGVCFDLSMLPAGRLIDGIPNWLLGVSYYTFMLLNAINPLPHSLLLASSFLALVLAIYLFSVLVFRLHIACPLCFASQAINLLIFLSLLLAG